MSKLAKFKRKKFVGVMTEITQRFKESVDEQIKVENFQPKRKLLTKPKFVMENTLNFATFEVKFLDK